MKRIVVIGGGSGIYALLQGLKFFLREHPESIHITAVITMSDDGGSTGKLREDHKVLPVGDTLKAMMALSDFDDEQKYGPFVFDTLHKLFVDLRFSKGAFEGDNLGNLTLVGALLTALKRKEDYLSVLNAFGEALEIRGVVLPVTLENITLFAKLNNGSVVCGETNIDIPKHDASLRIERIWIEPRARATKEAEEAIRNADIVAVGPGDLFTSVLPNFLVEGVSKALQESRAEMVLNCNLMTKRGETDGFRASDFVKMAEEYIQRKSDRIICNDPSFLSQETIEKYAAEGSAPISIDIPSDWEGRKIEVRNVARIGGGILRHDSEQIAKLVLGQ